MEPLLTRDKFRDAVFRRDGHKCVICGAGIESVPLDAHHIFERRLFQDGGYYVSNGASLCDRGKEGCHYKAETTEISVEDILEAANIDRKVMPPDLYPDHVYDKWGNSILSDGSRTKGPLFYDESVYQILKPIHEIFREWVKYPRTYHLPWSEGTTSDDKVIPDTSIFEGKEVIVTRKMDGENTSLYSDGYLHARSVDGRSHSSRDWVKSWWSQRAFDLPTGWRIVGENLYAKHSIHYDNLASYFLGFGIYDEKNVCLSWDETIEWFSLLDVKPVPVLWRGIFDEGTVKALWSQDDYDAHEGYVVRVAKSFPYEGFSSSVAKFVRKDHILTTKHWIKSDVVPNITKGKIDRTF